MIQLPCHLCVCITMTCLCKNAWHDTHAGLALCTSYKQTPLQQLHVRLPTASLTSSTGVVSASALSSTVRDSLCSASATLMQAARSLLWRCNACSTDVRAPAAGACGTVKATGISAHGAQCSGTICIPACFCGKSPSPCSIAEARMQ
jgi:hypothetical protein